ncbi:pantetheine-phosphate adenylyltransferase [Alphaproteobacteria bacterium]|nr:pantetheine-phosphate adenylyltransferase [Alphaproteobacteria bacterium]
MRTGFYPGSFDPITNGHIDIIKRGLSIVDKLVVGIGISATKSPLFTLEKRLAMIETEMSPIAKQMGVDLQVVSFDGLLVDVAREHGASLILRGLRTAADFEYEAQMTSMNRSMAPEVETVFLAASANVGFISSTLVRQIHAMGGDVSPFVPKVVLENI